MYQKYLIHSTIVCSIILLQTTTCFRLTTNSDRRSFQLDRSGWRSLNLSTSLAEQPRKGLDVIRATKLSSWFQTNQSSLQDAESAAPDAKKPLLAVQWDDDELLNDYQGESLRIGPKLAGGQELQDLEEPQDERKGRQRVRGDWSGQFRSGKRKLLGKLIYHGRVAKNGSTKVIDGAKIHINTHKPVSINRHHKSMAIRRHLEDAAEFVGSREDERLLKRMEDEPGRGQPDGAQQHQPEESPKSSSSEWRPIVMTSSNFQTNIKSRSVDRHDPMKSVNASYRIVSDEAPSVQPVKPATSNIWKPIKFKPAEGKMQQASAGGGGDGEMSTNGRSERFTKVDHIPQDSQMELEDSGGHFQRRTVSSTELPLDEPAGGFKSLPDNNRWTPVVDTTTESSSSLVARGDLSPLQGAHGQNGSHNHLDSAQKSASDLNYIYSPQQAPSRSEWLTGGTRSPSYGYQYSNNEMQQASGQVGGAGIGQTIVDTSSGQVPEMISERSPETTNVVIMPELTQVPQVSQPLNRPQSPYSYDTSSSYYARPQQAFRVAPQTTVSPQPVRQEHHYHYYGQQQQQPGDRQQPQQQPQQQQQPTQVIRELQPLFISQPALIQPVSSTTPAPQIIREIIKEVPAPQTMQIYGPQLTSRLIIPPMPPASLMRELDSSLGGYSPASYSMPAQRIIRQLSPAMVARIPQIRLPIPTIQIPARLAPAPPVASGITRQTGSFIIPPVPQKTTTYLTETQAMPTHTTIMHTTQFTPATRTTVYTTDHQATSDQVRASALPSAY